MESMDKVPSIMQTYHSRLSGNSVAECLNCGCIVAYWDDEDLDENFNLLCYCNEEDHRCAR